MFEKGRILVGRVRALLHQKLDKKRLMLLLGALGVSLVAWGWMVPYHGWLLATIAAKDIFEGLIALWMVVVLIVKQERKEENPCQNPAFA